MFDPSSTSAAALFACSPRSGGNTDHASALFARGVSEAGGRFQAIALRQYAVNPCQACHRCRHDPKGACFLSENDNSLALFQSLMAAPLVLFAAPVFFYHLPALFKNFIDRSQSYYQRALDNDAALADLPLRKAYVVLVAGRPIGEKLFEGSLLTLKYFLKPFCLEPADPLLLRGLDGPTALADAPALCDQVQAYGRTAWRESIRHARP